MLPKTDKVHSDTKSKAALPHSKGQHKRGSTVTETNSAQEAKNVFGKFQKHFLLSRRCFRVFNIYCVETQTTKHLGNTEKKLTLNVSRISECFLVCIPKQRMLTQNVPTAMFSVCEAWLALLIQGH